ncbi:Shedu anti-phage system protein SduA domain-containing protein [Pedobacter ureilyticus]|uniref:Shedu anti-phage system protein SduA domain-containing protein n=1 Tax=Pedobacter ureilyticus TaxID=1393051 RepID=A0ABW9J5E2_9SPHI|nr:Shedu anti-phage system protein SduA domain-containing protein [Pedobacter helvus]
MGKPSKTVEEKFQTKLKNLKRDTSIVESKGKIKVRNKIIFTYSTKSVNYTKKRYYSEKKDDIAEEGFTVKILLSHENLNLLNGNLINPPFGAKRVIETLRGFTGTVYEHITIGYYENRINANQLFLTKELYETMLLIDKEEGKDKKVRVEERLAPFISSIFSITVPTTVAKRDLGLLLKEIIASGEITQQDIVTLSNSLKSGDNNQVVIQKQINKQVEWLIETIETIIEEQELNTEKAKNFGSQLFGFNRSDISGPEHLMELILSKYGQYTLFGVPALLNTNKYVTHNSLSRSQFDIILITHLVDIEVVELKRPDQFVLEYDNSRGKFHPSKDLSIAIAQAERYISAVSKDNDDEYIIDGKKIRSFINEKIGDTLFVESVRPTALIIIGSWASITKDYSKLNLETRQKVSKAEYDENGLRTYKELKNSFRNIKLMNYSELLEHARTRLQLMKKEEVNEQTSN